MWKRLVVFILIIAPIGLWAQLLPKEGCSLNYRIIGFSFPAIAKANNYILEVAVGKTNQEDTFMKNKVLTIDVDSTRTIQDVPWFGKQYTWRVTGRKNKKVVGQSPYYHFATQTCPRVDTAQNMRLKILQPAAAQCKDYLVSINVGGVLYDMTGSPVWFIPDTNGVGGNTADLKINQYGTITFLYAYPFEININADVLWKAPQKELIGKDSMPIRYHHEFTRLGNGHYMALGTQMMTCKDEGYIGSGKVLVSNERQPQNGFKPAKFGTILEYDQKGNVVWKWESSKYLLEGDYPYFVPRDTNIKFDPHDNSFFFDENKNVIYLSFRNMDRVMKIAYPSGKVLATYGDGYGPGAAQNTGGLFCNPHCIRVSESGGLYFFNNNSCNNTDSLPTLVHFNEPENEKDGLKVSWQYTCPVEAEASKKFSSGGSVTELPNGLVYICMGSDYPKFMIINKNKEILWSALPQLYYPIEKLWRTRKQDRSCIITRSSFEKMVWEGEFGK